MENKGLSDCLISKDLKLLLYSDNKILWCKKSINNKKILPREIAVYDTI